MRIFGVISVLLNRSAKSGGNEDLAAKLAETFASHNCPARIRLAENGHDLRHLAEEAAKGEDDIVAAGGGDGTLNTVASAIMGTDKKFGVLPLGTLNHFAKDGGIPLNLNAAVQTLVSGEVKVIDVGEVNQRIFLNNASIGLYPEIVRRRNKEQEQFNRGKWTAMLKACVAAVKSSRFLHVHIRTADEELRRTTPFVFVGNNQYNLDGFGIGGRASLDSGNLCLWLARRTRPLGLIRLGLRAMVGTLRGARDFESLCGSEFRVTPHKSRIRVALDGETYFMDTPLNFRSRAAALKVMVPASAPS
jgi:YegS/Rv2252/BmrU family lipid kinase